MKYLKLALQKDKRNSAAQEDYCKLHIPINETELNEVLEGKSDKDSIELLQFFLEQKPRQFLFIHKLCDYHMKSANYSEIVRLTTTKEEDEISKLKTTKLVELIQSLHSRLEKHEKQEKK